MAIELTDDQLAYALRCYVRGVSGPYMARALKLKAIEADSLFDRFRKQGYQRNASSLGAPVTLPKLKYLEGAHDQG